MLVYFPALLSSPILNKTVIKLFSTGCRRVSSRGLRDQFEGAGRGGGKNWRDLEPEDDVLTTWSNRSARMIASGIFKQLRTFVVVSWCFEPSWNYILLSVTYNFGLGKWAKIEKNVGKLLCVKTSLVDWSLCRWAQ